MRAVNFLVDTTIIGVLTTICSVLVSDVSKYLLFALVSVIYYFCFEAFTGRTPGKHITNTVVVYKDGTKPGVFRIFVRSVLRLNPLDVYSYLLGTEIGTHDVLSGTRLQAKK